MHTPNQLHPRNLKHLSTHLAHLIRHRLYLQVILALILALITGTILRPDTGLLTTDTALTLAEWIALPGNLFLALIKIIIIPLIIASIIRGITSTTSTTSTTHLRHLGLRIAIYFLLTTLAAILIGITVTTLIQPGTHYNPPTPTTLTTTPHTTLPTLAEIPTHLINLLPINPLNSMLQLEMLQIVILSILTGIALITIQPQKAKPILELLGSIQALCMRIVSWAMLIVPLAVYGLLTRTIILTGPTALISMLYYILTVLLGLTLLLILYLLIITLFTHHHPLTFLRSIHQVQLLAFSTSSSAAVMPLSIRTAEENLHIRPSTSQLIIPLGTTINMDGTALYQAVATIFLAQTYSITLPPSALLTIILIAVASSIGAPGTPGIGILILTTILTTIGIPVEGLALILGVDRLLDMCRTTLNVTGDLVACAVMDTITPHTQSLKTELATQKQIETQQEKTNTDIITGNQTPLTATLTDRLTSLFHHKK